ncbi:uncharacterized protein LOC135461251 [Liolophura sinensis]|uniref:uncharacterized protein LOC135461251 n=1 Tax=Liolophura sinensis TaxID=3198878 RepID=UPI0031582031
MPVDKEEEAEVIKEYTYWLYLFVALERERATLHRKKDITPEVLMADRDYVMEYTSQTLEYLYWREQCPQQLTEKINNFATRVLEKFTSLEKTRKTTGKTPLEFFPDHYALDTMEVSTRPVPECPFELSEVLSPRAAERLSPPKVLLKIESDCNDNTSDVITDCRVIKSVNIHKNEAVDTRLMKKSKITKVKSFFARLRISPRSAIYRTDKTLKSLRRRISAAFCACATGTSDDQ